MKETTVKPVDFLTAGGRLSLEQFAHMDPSMREAFVDAGREVMARQAQEFISQFRDLLAEMDEDARLEAMAAKAEEALPR